MNRGRIQAQGGGTEKSEAWSLNTDHHKQMGIMSVDDLENQLTNPELALRRNALQQCKNRILTTPSCGVSAQMKKSYYDDFRNRKIRVDIEVNAGVAFVDNP
ncbi:hypothetical protein GCM10022422_14400 [Flavobacterium ginsengisoli]|uniref:Uncharacterized protein n=1 Tax=Flavobacterium ginsengisoli TaxID=871694 RepID=A0ABP7F8A7_9FLAO|nr:hypothetical protein [Flavobacterium ginsengisoli]